MGTRRYETRYTLDVRPFTMPHWTRKSARRAVEEGVKYGTPDAASIVYSDSSKAEHRAVFSMATYFKREFGYDFVQYDDPRFPSREPDHDARAFIWHAEGFSESNRPTQAVGACCFRLRTNGKPAAERASWWGLQWIWLHPYVRHTGLLTDIWPYFRDRFGSFHVELPLSPAMEAFVAKHGGDPYLIASAESRSLGLDKAGGLRCVLATWGSARLERWVPEGYDPCPYCDRAWCERTGLHMVSCPCKTCKGAVRQWMERA